VTFAECIYKPQYIEFVVSAWVTIKAEYKVDLRKWHIVKIPEEWTEE
jgi:hypothetical protein